VNTFVQTCFELIWNFWSLADHKVSSRLWRYYRIISNYWWLSLHAICSCRNTQLYHWASL